MKLKRGRKIRIKRKKKKNEKKNDDKRWECARVYTNSHFNRRVSVKVIEDCKDRFITTGSLSRRANGHKISTINSYTCFLTRGKQFYLISRVHTLLYIIYTIY